MGLPSLATLNYKQDAPSLLDVDLSFPFCEDQWQHCHLNKIRIHNDIISYLFIGFYRANIIHHCYHLINVNSHCKIPDFNADYYDGYPPKAATVESFLFSKVINPFNASFIAWVAHPMNCQCYSVRVANLDFCEINGWAKMATKMIKLFRNPNSNVSLQSPFRARFLTCFPNSILFSLLISVFHPVKIGSTVSELRHTLISGWNFCYFSEIKTSVDQSLILKVMMIRKFR